MGHCITACQCMPSKRVGWKWVGMIRGAGRGVATQAAWLFFGVTPCRVTAVLRFLDARLHVHGRQVAGAPSHAPAPLPIHMCQTILRGAGRPVARGSAWGHHHHRLQEPHACAVAVPTHPHARSVGLSMHIASGGWAFASRCVLCALCQQQRQPPPGGVHCTHLRDPVLADTADERPERSRARLTRASRLG